MKIQAVVFGMVMAAFSGVLPAQDGGNGGNGESEDLKSQVRKLSEIGEGFAAASAMSSASDSASLRDIASDYREFSNNFSSMQSYLENSNYSEATSTLRRWLARTKNSAVKEALTKLLAAVQAEEKKRAEKLAKDVDALLAGVAAKLKTVKAPDEIDDLQQDVRDFRNNQFNSSNREIQKLSNRLSQADSFLGNWRQFLAYEDAGEWGSALGMLRNLRRESQTAGLMSSKEISARFSTILQKRLAQTGDDEGGSETDAMLQKAVDDMMAGVKEPSDAKKALRQLSIIQNVSDGALSDTLNSLRSGLNNVARMQELLDRGAYAQILNPNWPAMGYRDSPYDQHVENLGVMLQVKALKALIGDANLGAPKEGQSMSAFLKEAAGKAFAAKDWDRLFTLLMYYSTLSGERYNRTSFMQEGVRALLAGQQLEKAEQYRDAVAQYTLCIAEVGPFVPREEAAEAIKRLRAAHPEAFRPEIELK